jgi:hypothetical protein
MSAWDHSRRSAKVCKSQNPRKYKETVTVSYLGKAGAAGGAQTAPTDRTSGVCCVFGIGYPRRGGFDSVRGMSSCSIEQPRVPDGR